MDFIELGDYNAARTILLFNNTKERSFIRDLWIAYCHYELGDYESSLKIYKELSYLDSSKYSQYILKDTLKMNMCLCLFKLQYYQQIKSEIEDLPQSKLGNRFRLHYYQRIGDESNVLKYHSKLEDTVMDQLCLASLHFTRGYYNEALKVFKKMHIDDPHMDELHLYAAMCYYKLEYFDRCLSTLQSYKQVDQESFIASNLKACVYYRLSKCTDAKVEIGNLVNVYPNGFNKVLVHNMALFGNKDNCLDVWHSCIHYIPEAACNIAIYHLKDKQLQHAKEIVDKIHPTYLDEIVVKAICLAEYGQEYNDEKSIQESILLFESIGTLESEKNTILGRQSMSSLLLLQNNYEEAEIYLESIKTFMITSTAFNMNYGQVKLRLNKYEEALTSFSMIKDQRMTSNWIWLFGMIKSRSSLFI